MIALKKLYGDELLRLALVLSLLKVDPNDYIERETQLLSGLHITNGTDWSSEQEARTLIRPRFIHPKSLDNILINYERELFEDLNSLGRYAGRYIEYNDRMWNNQPIHTYLVNNVATDTVAPVLAAVSQADEAQEQDGVSADDNVAQEVKVSYDDSSQAETVDDTTGEAKETTGEAEESEPEAVAPSTEPDVLDQTDTRSDWSLPAADAVVTLSSDFLSNRTESDIFDQIPSQAEARPTPDAVVTLSADFLANHTASDIFAEIATRSFDVNEFLIQPEEMQIKKEPEHNSDLVDVLIKKEPDHDDLYSDNAIDDFVPFFAAKTEKFEVDEPESVFHQNIADLQDYSELLDAKDLRNDFERLNVKQQQENLEQYLMENTPLDSEVYELAPMFEEELVLDMKRERASTSFTSSASSSGVSEMDMSDKELQDSDVKMEPDEGHHTGDELTQEDMDLIEVLWKQDVDMGFSLEDPVQPEGPHATKVVLDAEIDKELKAAEEQIQKKKEEEKQKIEEVKASLLDPEIKEDDPWAGVSYTVDTETGEYVLQGALPPSLVSNEESRFDLLEEALQLVELGDEAEKKNEQPEEAVEASASSSSAPADGMLHPAMRHVPHHHLAHYHNQSLMRSMSVEQRWQDLASLLTIPPPPVADQYHHHYQQHPHNISAHGAAGYAPNYHHGPMPPVPEKHPDAYTGAAAPLESVYKMESAHHPQQHDGLYYQNSTSEMPPPNQDGFLQSILNDEDLQLMDMAMNEGMYTMRMLDGAGGSHHVPHHTHSHNMMGTERDSASDSAVSSMGSERVPSLSDGEWCDGSDSAQEFHSSKFRPYEPGAYGRERAAPHHPQKKHHMFGKRYFQEQQQPALEPLVPSRVVKYECPEQAYQHDTSMHNMQHLDYPLPPLAGVVPPGPLPPGARACERVRHNHTYAAHAQDSRPQATRDKRVRRLTDGSVSDGGSSATSSGQHLSRDEKRAKALGIPLEVQEIINLPMDEFNERLSKHDLSEAQLSLIRDIRRRGKNKVAAQNCRKRKLDQITSLADEVRSVRDRKVRTQRDHLTLTAERQRVKERFAALYRHVFQNLRDPEGRPLSSSQYSLQQAADGNVVLVPKIAHHPDHMNRSSDDEMDRKTKNFEQ